MPRYFLNIRDGDELVRDPDGSDLPDLQAAWNEAILGARDVLAELLRQGEVLNGQQIEICDESGAILAILPMRQVLKLP